MVAVVAMASLMTQDMFRVKFEKVVATLDQLPYESVTKDLSLLKRFQERYPNFNFLEVADCKYSLYHLAAHPRHAAAYKSLSSVIDWKTFEGRSGSIRSAVIADESKLTQARLDEDKNTLLNRLMLSHHFLSERDALLAFDYFEKHKQLSLNANSFGQTPLMLAAEAGWNRIFDRLIQMKATLDAKDSEGRDVIDYLKFSRAEVNAFATANREAFTTEAIADSLHKRSNAANKKRLFKAINDWLGNPYRLDCSVGLERYMNLTWPTPTGRKGAPKINLEYTIDPPKYPIDLPKSQWDPRKSGGW
jgi:hypothetical protein